MITITDYHLQNIALAIGLAVVLWMALPLGFVFHWRKFTRVYNFQEPVNGPPMAAEDYVALGMWLAWLRLSTDRTHLYLRPGGLLHLIWRPIRVPWSEIAARQRNIANLRYVEMRFEKVSDIVLRTTWKSWSSLEDFRLEKGIWAKNYRVYAICLQASEILLLQREGRWFLPGGLQSWDANEDERRTRLMRDINVQTGSKISMAFDKKYEGAILGSAGIALTECYIVRTTGDFKNGTTFNLSNLPKDLDPECAAAIEWFKSLGPL